MEGGRGFVRHLLLGLGYGYPPCCALRWAWESRRTYTTQAKDRGVRFLDTERREGVHVPCCVFHEHDLEFGAWVREVELRGLGSE